MSCWEVIWARLSMVPGSCILVCESLFSLPCLAIISYLKAVDRERSDDYFFAFNNESSELCVLGIDELQWGH